MDINRLENQVRTMAHLALVFSIAIFSFVLIVLNIVNGWEKWMIPLLCIAVIIALVLHISGNIEEHIRIYVYAFLGMFEVFLYIVNEETIMDATPIVAAALIIFMMAQEIKLVRLLLVVSYIGMIYKLLQIYYFGDGVMTSHDVVRIIWHFALLFVVSDVLSRINAEFKKTIDNYEAKIDDLETKNQSATDFLANVSHEIRTPINAVIGLTTVCMDKTTSEDIKEDLMAVSDAGKRVAEQVSDILDYSEIDMHRLAVNKEDYMLSSVINDLVTELKPYMRDDVELIIDVDPNVPSVMNTDSSKLKKILWHLIGNGLKYTKQGGVYVKISSNIQPYGINLCVSVTDTGVGMSQHEMDHVFERFYQGDSGRTRSTSGLGLGLSIVVGFLRSMSGFLTINSIPDKGSTVTVSIPQTVVDPVGCISLPESESVCIAWFVGYERISKPEVREFYYSMIRNIVGSLKIPLHRIDNIESLKRLLKKAKVSHVFVDENYYRENAEYLETSILESMVIVIADSGFKLPEYSKARILKKPYYGFTLVSMLSMDNKEFEESEGKMFCHGIRALVVDDEPMNHTVAKGVFKGYGMEVFTADSGKEGINMCRENDYDIIFMDHMMPEMDGIEAMRIIRADATRAGKEFPIVALTANAVSSAKEMFLNEGFDGFVSKPIEIVELERVLKKVLPKASITYEKIDRRNLRIGKESSDSSEVSINRSSLYVPGMAEDVLPVYEKLSEKGIDIKKGRHYCQDDDSFYESLLLQFASDAGFKKKDLDRFFDEMDFENYTILVHSLKSTAKMVGAGELSDLAKSLEEASKVHDTGYVVAHHAEFSSWYEDLTDSILAAYGKDKAKDGSKDSASSESEEDEIMEFVPEDFSDHGEIMEFEPESPADDIMEFEPESPADDILEFVPESPADDILEFSPEGGEQS